MTRYVITGASRGIGLAMARLLSEDGVEVIAAVRRPTPDLEAVGCEIAAGVDVTSDDGAAVLVEALNGRHVDVLINNAGLLIPDTLDSLDFAAALRQYEINALGPLRISRALLPLMGEGGKIGIVTSRVGSLGDNRSGGNYGYRMSKAAANMAARNLAIELKEKGIAVAALHPGYVRTAMTGGRGNIDAEPAAKGLLLRIEELGLETTGTFWHAEGYELPW
ncbi:MAG TPA: SDR family oxidoreductase [Thermopetrobacter sp.]|nr:SDR family oxidoreductase [Thermopetrobacter sp.]